MFGEHAQWMTITLIEDYPGFLLAILPPGAFMCLGLLIAIKNRIDRRVKQTKPLTDEPAQAQLSH
jgi:electron transport complex protein RnfE